MPDRLLTLLLGTTACLFFFAASAHAMLMTYGGTPGDSLHGATGSLEITAAGSGTYDVIWAMNFDGYEGSVGDHQYLTDIGFKAFTSVSVVSLDEIMWSPTTTGTLIPAGNISNAGCEGPASADFVCVADLDPMVDATLNGIFEAHFTVTGDLKLDGWSYRGKFGTEEGWVISEGGSTAVPEPTAALVFGLGIATVGLRVRRQTRD